MEAADKEDMKFLRRHGWQIMARPATGDVIWWHREARLTLTQTEAIEHEVLKMLKEGKLKS